jgi:hypothetical protein
VQRHRGVRSKDDLKTGRFDRHVTGFGLRREPHADPPTLHDESNDRVR